MVVSPRGGSTIYAIIRSGSRQYRVQPEQTLDVDRIQAEVGSTVDLGVLLLGGNGDTKVGTPLVEGVRVVAEVLEHGRGEKIRVFKYKNKTRYRRRLGHRQDFTRLAIREIVGAGEEAEEKKTPSRRRAKAEEAPKSEAVATAAAPEDVAEIATEAAVETPPEAEAVAEDAPAPKTRKRASTKPKAQPDTEAEAKPARKPRARKAAPEANTEEPKEE